VPYRASGRTFLGFPELRGGAGKDGRRVFVRGGKVGDSYRVARFKEHARRLAIDAEDSVRSWCWWLSRCRVSSSYLA
jgi:hypothetical protein